MPKRLPSRPDLDHLRRQSKQLLARLKDGERDAARVLIEHLPEARKMSVAAVLGAGFRLADAQSAVARQSGFASWPALSRHVQQLRALEGDWRFESLEVDGAPMPPAMLPASRLLIDGDRFRTESPEANYEGVFTIDVEHEPPRIDIEFVEGPEAGQWSYGIYTLDGDRFRLCLGLTGAPRPEAFVTRPGSGHALEHLVRASASRPDGVTGGTRGAATSQPEPADPAAFGGEPTELMRKLEGEWLAVELVRDGKAMPAQWLSAGRRVASGNEVKVVFGGQTMVHARVKIDERVEPIAIDYLHLAGEHKGGIGAGILEWIGGEVRFLMAPPGEPRPAEWSCEPGSRRTLSRWRRAE